MVSSRLEGSKYRLIIQVEKEVKKLEVKNVVVIGWSKIRSFLVVYIWLYLYGCFSFIIRNLDH